MRNELCRSVGDINNAPDPINTGLIKTVSTIISDSLNDQNTQPPAWSTKDFINTQHIKEVAFYNHW